MADAIAIVPDQRASRDALGIDGNASVLAVLPGSRRGEVDTLLPVFLETIEAIHAKRSDIQFLS
jgi:lipid-A-disaccharide synthase